MADYTDNVRTVFSVEGHAELVQAWQDLAAAANAYSAFHSQAVDLMEAGAPHPSSLGDWLAKVAEGWAGLSQEGLGGQESLALFGQAPGVAPDALGSPERAGALADRGGALGLVPAAEAPLARAEARAAQERSERGRGDLHPAGAARAHPRRARLRGRGELGGTITRQGDGSLTLHLQGVGVTADDLSDLDLLDAGEFE